MPTPFNTSFTTADLVEVVHVRQFAKPVNRLETGQAFYVEQDSLSYTDAYVLSDAYVVTMIPFPTAYSAGMRISFRATVPNQGPATLNVNGLGVRAIQKNGSQDLDTGDIVAGQVTTVLYDGTHFQLQTTGLAFLDQLADVEAPSPAEGDRVSYHSATGKWQSRSGALAGVFDVDAASPSPNDALVYSADSGRWVASPPPFGRPVPDFPPASPDPANDEFGGAALDTAGTRRSGATAWAWRNQGSATATLADGFLTLTSPTSSSDNYRIVEQAAPTAPWTYRAKLLDVFLNESNQASGGLVLVNTSTGKMLAFLKSYEGGLKLQVGRFDSVSSWNSDNTLSAVFASRGFHAPLYLEIENDGTTLTFRYSDSGLDGTFITLATETLSGFISAVHTVGIASNNSNSHSAQTMVEWFRRIA